MTATADFAAIPMPPITARLRTFVAASIVGEIMRRGRAMMGPFGVMYRLDASLNQRFSFVGSTRLVALVHLTIYWIIFVAAAGIAHFLLPDSPQTIWLTANWPWLPIPIEFAYMIYSLCRSVVECRTSEAKTD